MNVKNNWLVAHLAFTATYEYAVKHHNRYPRAYRWEEEIKPYWIKTVPFDVTLFNRENLPYRLAMNAQLSAKKMGSFDDNMPLFYGLLSTKSNAHGLPIDVSNEPGRERPVIVYVNGHSFGE